MIKLDSLISELRSFEETIEVISERVVKENEAIVVEMNSEIQLYEKGQTREGIKIDSYAPYRPMTIEIKQSKGQPVNRVTLRDEGDFHSSFYIEFTQGGFEIKASDPKTPDLLFGYGDEILGLDQENLIDLTINYILPEIIKHFKG